DRSSLGHHDRSSELDEEGAWGGDERRPVALVRGSRYNAHLSSLIHQWDYFFPEPFDFLEHRAHLNQEYGNPGFNEPQNLVGDLLGGAGEAGAQPAVRDAVVAQSQLAFELTLGSKVLESKITGRVLDISYAFDLCLDLALIPPADGVRRNTIDHGTAAERVPAARHVLDLGHNIFRGIAMHQVPVAKRRDHLLRVFGFAASIKGRPRFPYRLRL